MSTKEMVKELNVAEHSLILYLQGKIPHVDYKNECFTFLWNLIEKIPELSEELYIQQFAYLSNFYWKAGEFQVIESIPEYQKFYLNRIEMERNQQADIFEYRLTDYKIFDVSVMHAPKVENKQLIYYTYNTSNKLPYRVVCPFPYHLTSTYVHYQVLPLK